MKFFIPISLTTTTSSRAFTTIPALKIFPAYKDKIISCFGGIISKTRSFEIRNKVLTDFWAQSVDNADIENAVTNCTHFLEYDDCEFQHVPQLELATRLRFVGNYGLFFAITQRSGSPIILNHVPYLKTSPDSRPTFNLKDLVITFPPRGTLITSAHDFRNTFFELAKFSRSSAEYKEYDKFLFSTTSSTPPYVQLFGLTTIMEDILTKGTTEKTYQFKMHGAYVLRQILRHCPLTDSKLLQILGALYNERSNLAHTSNTGVATKLIIFAKIACRAILLNKSSILKVVEPESLLRHNKMQKIRLVNFDKAWKTLTHGKTYPNI